MKFEWDSKKSEKNFKKHSIRFSAAIDSFEDLSRIEEYDEARSTLYEDRYKSIGFSPQHQLLITTIFTYRNGATRIISARIATRKEREKYYDCQ